MYWPAIRYPSMVPPSWPTLSRIEDGWVQMGQVEDRCVGQGFVFTFQQPCPFHRVWDHRWTIGQKCSKSKMFTTVAMFPQEILKENLRMFELVQKHPSHWPPFVPPAKPEVTTTGAGKSLVQGSWASRPRCSSCFMRQKQRWPMFSMECTISTQLV